MRSVSRLTAAIRIHNQRLAAKSATRKRLPRQLYPKLIEGSYYSILKREVVDPTYMRIRILLPALLARRPRLDAFADDVSESLDGVSDSVLTDLQLNRVRNSADQIADRVNVHQKQQLEKQLSSYGIPIPDRYGARLTEWVGQNVALIKTIPTQFLDGVKQDVINAVRLGKRNEEVAALVADRYYVTDRRARVIARDQIGKIYGELNQARQEDIGVKSYIWRTVGDERVRDEHADREGEQFDWDSPPEDGHPGEPIQCRCHAEPVIEDIFAEEAPYENVPVTETETPSEIELAPPPIEPPAPEFVPATPIEFEAAKSEMVHSTPGLAANLAPKSPEDYKHLTTYLGFDSKVGFGLTDDGDIVNVFNNGGPKGSGIKAMVDGVKVGGRVLDCYDGFLPDYYARLGFRETGRMPFNDAFAPPGWDIEKQGRPDVVFMAYKNGDPQTLESRVGKFPIREKTDVIETDWDQAKLRSRQEASYPPSNRAWTEAVAYPEPTGLAGVNGRPVDGRGIPSGEAAKNPESFSAVDFKAAHIGAPVTEEQVLGMSLNPVQRAEYDRIIREVNEAEAQGRESYKLHSVNGDGVTYTAAAKAQHDETLAKLFENSDRAKPAEGEKPTVIMLGGRGGSGKSEFGKPGPQQVYDPAKVILLDTDEFKKSIEGYEAPKAYLYHHESSDIFKQALKIAQEGKLNIVLDVTMSSSTQKYIDEFTSLGYNVEAHYMYLPPEKSAMRGMLRWAEPSKDTPALAGRLVPPKILLGMTENEANFDAIKGQVSKWSFMTNDVPKGEKPILVASGP